MNFRSLSSVIASQILSEAARSASGNVRINAGSALNSGNSRLARIVDYDDPDAFVWGTTKGVWGKNTISVNYKP